LDVVGEAVPDEAEEEGQHHDNENLVYDFYHLLDLVVESQLVVFVVALVERENQLFHHTGRDEFRADTLDAQ